MKSSVLFDQIGGDELRAVITDFYARVFSDVMIGFMFQGKNRQYLIEREYELTSALLGAPGASYSGLPMRAAHARLTIFGGQFERRMQILRETMRDHGVAAEVQQAWIDHQLSLRSQITRDRGSECDGPAAAASASAPRLAIARPDEPDRLIKLGRK
jgi:hemoglobin